MGKISFKPGNMLFPLPAVLVTVADKEGHDNMLTIAWAGTVCSDPAMVSISVRKERFSHHMLMENGEFVINLTTESLAYATDYCGVRSGRDVDKWTQMNLHRGKALQVSVPVIEESPVNIECRVTAVKELGSHDMFLADIVAVDVDPKFVDEKGALHMEKANLLAYAHGAYFGLGKQLGTFGFSVRKKPLKKGRRPAKKK